MWIRFTCAFKKVENPGFVELGGMFLARKCLICRYLKVSVAGRLCDSRSVGKGAIDVGGEEVMGTHSAFDQAEKEVKEDQAW